MGHEVCTHLFKSDLIKVHLKVKYLEPIGSMLDGQTAHLLDFRWPPRPLLWTHPCPKVTSGYSFITNDHATPTNVIIAAV